MAEQPRVAIIMGSRSDWPTMKGAAESLEALGVAYEAKVISAHRTPERLYSFAKGARVAGFKVIIAGAGGAAHLPGMAASMTTLPVLGVPVQSRALNGLDSLLVDRPDAGGGAGRNACDRRGGGPQRRADGGADPRAFRRRAGAAARRPPGAPDGVGLRHCRGSARRRMTKPFPLPPGATIGILGGGQLGRMLSLAAARLGFDVAILAPEPNSPAARVSAHAIVADYEDPAALDALAAPRRRDHLRVRERPSRGPD